MSRMAGSGAGAGGTPAGRSDEGGELRELAGHSRTVFVWSVVSRLTGFLRVALLAAVLGPTFFGNLYQTLIYLPYVVCQLTMASLIPAILTPHLVRLMEDGRHDKAVRLAGSCLGLALVLFTLTAIATVAVAPIILELVTLAVPDEVVRAEQMRLGWLLLVLIAPQVPLYAVAMIGIAAQHARRRFALATAAHALENISLVGVLLVAAMVFGVGGDVGTVTSAQLLLLGLGATFAVAVQAAAQWWGAARAGFRLLPRLGWRDPEMRRVLAMALPSSGSAAFIALGMLAMLVVAGGVPGGAVAFQVAHSLFNLPIALGARPIAAAQLPLLSRSFAVNGKADARLIEQAFRLALFAVLPAMLVMLVLPEALATLVTFGGMRTDAGMTLVVAALAGLGFAIAGETVVVVGASAAYARHDATRPFRAIALQTGVLLAGLAVIASTVGGPQRLTAIGLLYALASLIAALYLYRRTVPVSGRAFQASVLKDAALAGIAALAGWGTLRLWPGGSTAADGFLSSPATIGIGEAVGALSVVASSYLILQFISRSNELGLLLASVRPLAGRRGNAA